MNVLKYCGCCFKEDCCKDMCSEYYKGDEKEEIYADIMLNTFNIKVTTSMICQDCITKLCNAASFKEQVLKAQDNIIQLMNTNSLALKLIESVNNIDDNDIDAKDNDFISDNDMWDVRSSVRKEQLFIHSKKDKKLISKTVKPLLRNTQNISSVNKCIKNTQKRKSPADINSSPKINVESALQKSIEKSNIGESQLPITQSEINSRSNTLKLIQNSNLCLFRSLKTRFGCFLCQASFVDVSKLREHSLTHTNASLLACRINKCRGLSFKNADISQLKCNICSEVIIDLTELMSHLKNNHDFLFSGTNNFLIPYKLSENYQCVVCGAKFQSFLRLSIHMNSHYKNNVCEFCGLSFINRMSIRTHMQSMHKEKKCSLCPAKFLTMTSKVKHLKEVHNYFNSKTYCNLCDKTFKYTYLLRNHKIEEHGEKKIIVNCHDCGKTFFSEANLKIHIRYVHKKERNYQCEICGTRFFTKFDQKRHERSHNDVRSFCCDYCDAKFKSKDSCRRHMKRQHGHVFP